MNERKRIANAYAKRDQQKKSQRYSLSDPANLFLLQSREKKILALLKTHGFSSLSDKKILGVGCGRGRALLDLMRYGAVPGNIFGIDLLPDRIEEAKKINTKANLKCGTAEELPYANQSFDMVQTFTVFSSIFSKAMRRRIAGEILRVLKTEGVVLWCDFFLNNPWNHDVEGVNKREIISLFPGCIFDFHKIILAPPLTRTLIRYSWFICYLLEMFPFLRTHYLVVIKKGKSSRAQ